MYFKSIISFMIGFFCVLFKKIFALFQANENISYLPKAELIFLSHVDLQFNWN